VSVSETTIAHAGEGEGRASDEAVKAGPSYDEFVAKSPQGSVFAHRWWLDAVAPGRYQIFVARKGSQLDAVWPIVRSEVDGEVHVHMPAITQKLGIMFAATDAKPVEAQSARQKYCADLIDQLGPTTTFFQNFHENFTDWLPFYWNGFTQTTRYTYVLEDISDSEVVWNGMRTNHRRVIRRAQRLGIQITDTLPLEDFLTLYHMTFSRQGVPPLADDDTIRRIDAAVLANAGRKIFAGVDANGNPHAAVYVVWADGTAYYLMGGSDPELRESGAQLLAFWEAIKFAKNVAKRFDFEGSMLPNIERNFRGFGTRQLSYFSIMKMPIPPTTVGAMLKASARFRAKKVRNRIKKYFNI
jgi:hypothetical protein